MRPTSRILVATVASCVLASCEEPAPKASGSPADTRAATVFSGWVPDSAKPAGMAAALSQPSATASEILDLKVDSISDPLDLLTSKIDTTVTLGDWLESHPGDEVGTVPLVSSSDDPFCRGAVIKTPLWGRILVRYALFYIPAPPIGEKLPTDSARIAEDYCELRTIVLVSEGIDSPADQSLRDSLAIQIDKRLGPHREGLPLGAGGVRSRGKGKIWNGPGTRVVVARELVDDGASARTFAVAYAPGSGAQDFDTWQSRYKGQAAERADNRQSLYRNVDSALTWAALPAVTIELTSVLNFLKSRHADNQGELRPPQVDAALLRAIKAIHDVAPSLPAARRAGVLLAGDVTLFATLATPSADSNATISRTLTLLRISASPLNGEDGYQNTRGWLWEAYRVDPTGRAGRAAFAELLGLRWPGSGACTPDGYARVIEHGETSLDKGNDDPLVHFYVGSAYKTIYNLANFSSVDYDTPVSVTRQSESARLKGIEHFRVALASLPDRPVRRDAWTKAMRLLLRRSGEQPEYVCFGD